MQALQAETAGTSSSHVSTSQGSISQIPSVPIPLYLCFQQTQSHHGLINIRRGATLMQALQAETTGTPVQNQMPVSGPPKEQNEPQHHQSPQLTSEFSFCWSKYW